MFPFNNLKVYEKAFEFNRKVYGFIDRNPSLPQYLRNQFGRASLSIVLNIAEGSAKFSQKDRRNFYIIARGSVFESASLIDLLKEEGKIDSLIQTELIELLKEISAMLFSLINKLAVITKKT